MSSHADPIITLKSGVRGETIVLLGNDSTMAETHDAEPRSWVDSDYDLSDDEVDGLDLFSHDDGASKNSDEAQHNAGEWISFSRPGKLTASKGDTKWNDNADTNDNGTTSDSPASPKKSLMDAMIGRLLQQQPDSYNKWHGASSGQATFTSEDQELFDNHVVERIEHELSKGDTLVVMDFPTGYKRCNGREWKSIQFKVHSQKLLATGSSVFADLLSPRRQARFIRRFGPRAADTNAEILSR